ncbi:hypothetical protein JCM10908_001378 [Rhodotorula pacifica]|uniref:uncharacterized protein n=1 Tax=Rhodotorula pacifica TaxID=1495444 RepID=UPI003176A5D8
MSDPPQPTVRARRGRSDRPTLSSTSAALRTLVAQALKNPPGEDSNVRNLGLALLNAWVKPLADFVRGGRNHQSVRKSFQDLSRILGLLLVEMERILKQECPAQDRLREAAKLLRDRYWFDNIATILKWQATPQELAEANSGTAFATCLVTTPNLEDVELPAMEPSKKTDRLAYSTWCADLLQLISLDVLGLHRKRNRGADWTHNKGIINQAAPNLAEILYDWREERKRQLSQQRYDALTAVDAEAWCQWLVKLREMVQSTFSYWSEHVNQDSAITNAASVILSYTWEKIEYEVAVTAERTTTLLHAAQISSVRHTAPTMASRFLDTGVAPAQPFVPGVHPLLQQQSSLSFVANDPTPAAVALESYPPNSAARQHIAPHRRYEEHLGAQDPLVEWHSAPHESREWAIGHAPRIAGRIARTVYGIDPDAWHIRHARTFV